MTYSFATSRKSPALTRLRLKLEARAKERLSFKAGVFGAIEPPETVRFALWAKMKNSILLAFHAIFVVSFPTYSMASLLMMIKCKSNAYLITIGAYGEL